MHGHVRASSRVQWCYWCCWCLWKASGAPPSPSYIKQIPFCGSRTLRAFWGASEGTLALPLPVPGRRTPGWAQPVPSVPSATGQLEGPTEAAQTRPFPPPACWLLFPRFFLPFSIPVAAPAVWQPLTTRRLGNLGAPSLSCIWPVPQPCAEDTHSAGRGIKRRSSGMSRAQLESKPHSSSSVQISSLLAPASLTHERRVIPVCTTLGQLPEKMNA